MRVLGISAYYHDSAAALVDDGRIVAAAQEERFTRKKHDDSFPARAIEYCLREAGVDLAHVDRVAFYDKPLLTFDRIFETYLAFAPRGFGSFRRSMPRWLGDRLFSRKNLERGLASIGDFDRDRLRFCEHHLSHAASAFYPSPFDDAVVLTMDGVGEWATTTVARGEGASLEMLREIRFPHSLGLLYAAFTYYVGFKINSGEYKLMGLAAYGEPTYAKRILEHLVDAKADGSFRLNMKYFDYCTGVTMTNAAFDALFGGPARKSNEPIEQRHRDLAASIQAVLEEIVLRLTRALAKELGSKNLCLAGGVALNCVANGRVLRDGAFERLWVQPAAGDAGGALGAAFAALHESGVARAPRPDRDDAMNGALLGPSATQAEIEAALKNAAAVYEILDETAIVERAARDLDRGLAIGWFQGRMEFGPRALGARSILADARSPTMQALLNEKVKQRETFRPFAPAVPIELASKWFDLDTESPYMLLVADVREVEGRTKIPAVTHVDGSARLQTVRRETHPRYHALLMSFYRLTGCPVIVNTSFNVRGEPIVCTPADAIRCFFGADLDALVIGDAYLRRADQDPAVMARFTPALGDD